MGLIEAVGAGSTEKCSMLIMNYKSNTKSNTKSNNKSNSKNNNT